MDGSDISYFGGGDGRLYGVNPDGTLRWSYQLITDDRNDLNSSPALGFDGIYIAGESGEMFFVPYDYPLSASGKTDRAPLPVAKICPQMARTSSTPIRLAR